MDNTMLVQKARPMITETIKYVGDNIDELSRQRNSGVSKHTNFMDSGVTAYRVHADNVFPYFILLPGKASDLLVEVCKAYNEITELRRDANSAAINVRAEFDKSSLWFTFTVV